MFCAAFVVTFSGRGMRRREFLRLVSAGAVAWPLGARAQQTERMRRVGVVMGYAESDPNGQLQVTAFRQQLQKLGWADGSNIRIDLRYAGADQERIRMSAVELMSLTPDVMVANSNLV